MRLSRFLALKVIFLSLLSGPLVFNSQSGEYINISGSFILGLSLFGYGYSGQVNRSDQKQP